MKWIIALCLFTAPAVADTCPPVPDRSAEKAFLFDSLASARNEVEAQPFNQGLWEIWTEAPDTIAQSMLDEGMARMRVADYLGAVAVFDRLTAYCPDYAEGYNQRAFTYFLGRNFIAALADLDRALVLEPNHVGALSGKGLTLIELGREAEAQEALRAAVALHPWLAERALLPESAATDL